MSFIGHSTWGQSPCLEFPQQAGSPGPSPISLWQMRGVTTHGVSELAQGHEARKWQHWGVVVFIRLELQWVTEPTSPSTGMYAPSVFYPRSVSFCTEGAWPRELLSEGGAWCGGGRGENKEEEVRRRPHTSPEERNKELPDTPSISRLLSASYVTWTETYL